MSPATTIPGISHKELQLWRFAQLLLWLLGTVIIGALFLAPEIGIHAFWNVLIPLAPALLVVSPGIWRNICPLATTVLFPRHINISARAKISPRFQSLFSLVGISLLLLLVPLRHVIFDTSGLATALTILSLATLGVASGFLFEWKSGWCSGLCPVHPVEKLYGSNPIISTNNAHCALCEQCVVPCPDSTKGMTALKVKRKSLQEITGKLMVGGFPGFVWGWFQVGTYSEAEGWSHLLEAYIWPFGGLIVSLLLFLLLERILPKKHRTLLSRFFAFGAVACYYWFRAPMLVGFGLHPGSGTLIDLTNQLPTWFPTLSHITTTALFAWLLLGRRSNDKHSWMWRPPFAKSR